MLVCTRSQWFQPQAISWPSVTHKRLRWLASSHVGSESTGGTRAITRTSLGSPRIDSRLKTPWLDTRRTLRPDWFWELAFNGPASFRFDSGCVGCRWRRLRDDRKPIPHKPFPLFKAAVAGSSYVGFSLTRRKTVRLHQVIQNHLARRRIDVQQSSRLRQTQIQTWQVQVFGKEPSLCPLQTQ